MPDTPDLSIFVTHRPNRTAAMELAVDGVGCAACIRKIENGLMQVSGISAARLNLTDRRLAVEWDEDALSAGEVVQAVERIGYHAYPFRSVDAASEEARHAHWLLRCLAVAGFGATNIMLLSVSVWSGHVSDMTEETRDLFHWLSALIALPVAAYAGQPFFRSALRALRARQVNMDVPISVGIVLALGMSTVETVLHAQHAYFDSAIMLIFFLLCGRYLEQAMRRRTRAVAGNLAALKAEVAHRFAANNEIVIVPAAALRVGDRILIRPGERVPADGVVVSGTSEVDGSLITGETKPEAAFAGATIYAGSNNISGTLTVRVTAAASGTLVDEVQRLLDKALAEKSRVMRLADRAASLYAPVVHLTGALTVLAWLAVGASVHDAVVTGIAVLIITCPCALALAIPAVHVVASGRLFRCGVILNAGDALERLARVDTVVFDKTGTLTLPEPRVANASELPADMVEAAARLALSSRHPLAAAVAREATLRIPYDSAEEIPGCGVRATLDGVEARLGSPDFCGVPARKPARAEGSIVAFSWGNRSMLLTIRQSIRPEAAATVAALVDLGLNIRILSGDRPEAVAPVAANLGIGNWTGGVSPADKIAEIKRLRGEGRRILMVGDGLNDAPALAAADVSISPISAAHMTQAQADAVFLGEQLTPVIEAVLTARKAHQLITQNLFAAVSYNAIAVPIAIAGYVTPLVAAVAMSGSSILVTVNALRARRAP